MDLHRAALCEHLTHLREVLLCKGTIPPENGRAARCRRPCTQMTANRGNQWAFASLGQLARRSGDPRFTDVFLQPSQRAPVVVVEDTNEKVHALAP
jgi:hypothetical protein